MPDRVDRELERLLQEGREPRRPNRRLRLTILAVVLALLVAAFLTLARLSHPRAGGSSTAIDCKATLRFRGRVYLGEKVRSNAFVQSEAIGVGTVPPCGSTQAAQYDVRSLVGVAPSVAVALPGAANVVYVRRGVCAGLSKPRLARCLRQHG